MTQLNAFDAIVSRYVERTGKRKVMEKHPFLGFGVSPPDNAVRFTLPKNDATFWDDTYSPPRSVRRLRCAVLIGDSPRPAWSIRRLTQSSS